MGFWKRLFKRDSQQQVTVQAVTIPQGIWPDGDSVFSDYQASCIACVKRCMEIKCGSVASLGLHVYKRRTEGGRSWFEDNEGSPLDRVLSETPNSRQNAYDFLWDIVYCREMYGNAYVIPVYSGGVLRELVGVPPECTVSYDRQSGLYTVNDPYDNIFGDFAEDEIIHIRGYGHDGFLGDPVTRLAGKILSTVEKTYRQQGEMFTPGYTLRGFITGEETSAVGFGGLQDDQLEAAAKRIRRELRQGEHLPFLSGSMKFVPTSMTPADLQLLDSMKFLNLEICRFFGVPPTQVFQDSNANYKSSETSQTIFMTSTLAPLIRQVEKEFNVKLLSPDLRRNYRIQFRLDDYYQSDPTVMSGALGNLVQRGVMTPNDARERLGMRPLEGGDRLVVIGGKAVGGSQ